MTVETIEIYVLQIRDVQITVSIPAVFWGGWIPLESQIPPENHPKNSQNFKMHQIYPPPPPPPRCVVPQNTESRIHTASINKNI